MKALPTVVLDELYELLSNLKGEIFELGRGASDKQIEAEVEIVRRNEGFIEIQFLCTHFLEGEDLDGHIWLKVEVSKR